VTGARVLILGSQGQLGFELQRSFATAAELLACDRAAVDLENPDQIRAVVREKTPDVILNAAAYTAVDRAESEPDRAMAINARAPEVLAEEAARQNALLVHYSTDYVFDGTKTSAWVETDAIHPLNVYGASKLAGEQAIAAVGGKYLIFRTSWVYAPRGKNFLLTMLRLGRERERIDVVDDQTGAPTSSIELAESTRAIVDMVTAGESGPLERWAGIYHMTCAGSVSWCGFAKAIFDRAAPLLGERKPEVRPIRTDQYPTPALRPRNSVMSNEKLRAIFGVRLPSWSDALDRVLLELER
jgi:dTDP-4-dehydrorhamnose reductase